MRKDLLLTKLKRWRIRLLKADGACRLLADLFSDPVRTASIAPTDCIQRQMVRMGAIHVGAERLPLPTSYTAS